MPKYRGMHLSKDVLYSVLNYCNLHNKRIIKLAVKEDNIKAISLYNSIGFKYQYKNVFLRFLRFEKKKTI